MNSAFDIVSKNSSPNQGHLDFLLCFLLEVLVLHFTFRPMVYFELIFFLNRDGVSPC